MKQVPIIGLAVAAIVFLADQATKFIVTDVLGLDVLAGRMIELLPIFRIRFVANEGVSLGLLTAGSDGARWALVALTGVIAAGVLVWMWRERNRQDRFALGLVLGGAAGNIIDRARLGYVVDFADLHFGDWSPFLVFNLGDAAITMGVIILLARAVIIRDKAPVQALANEGPVEAGRVENDNA